MPTEKKYKTSDYILSKTLHDAEEKAVLDTLRSKFWASGAGVGNVRIFENKFKKYTNANECLAVNSGTAALNIAVSLVDVKDKEVIIPSLSFISTANCILMTGSKPILCDINYDDGNIDIKSTNEKPDAIIPVHLYGNPCDFESIKNISETYNVPIIEDACQAHCAT